MNTIINCQRCGARCRVAGSRNPDAKMLRRSKEPKGLCVNCAVHDWLRNTYPCNILLAQSGAKALIHPHIQEQFTEIMRIGMADAMPDEICWDLIIENWNMPFPHKIKPSATNPVGQLEFDEVAAGERPPFFEDYDPSKRQTVCGENLEITSFEQLNEIEPGLGDDLRDCVGKE